MKRIAFLLIIGAIALPTAGSAEVWKYKNGTKISNDGVFAACETPDSLDEFMAMMKLQAYESMATYSRCIVVSDGQYEGISLGGYGDYLKVTAKDPAGKAMTFWTRRGYFRSEKDWKVDRCVDDAENKKVSPTHCYEMSDRDSWDE